MSESDHEHGTESKPVVVAALLANLTIGGLKFGAFALTGSAAMLAEFYHSLSDTGNQILLLIGLSRSSKAPTRTHPFGHGKAQFFYGFLVSVLLFGVAGWRSISAGLQTLTHLDTATATTLTAFGGVLPGIVVSYAVLGGVLVCEGWSWRKAHRTLREQIDAHEWDGFAEAFRRTSDTTTLTTFIEDSAAVVGAFVALAGITLSHLTGNPVYDGVAALVIGAVLMTGAVVVAWTNHRLLLGKSLPHAEERRLYAVVADREVVVNVPEFRTVHFGPETVVIVARVTVADDLRAGELSDWIATIKTDLIDAHPGVATVYLTPDHTSTDSDATNAKRGTTAV
ncbi:MAG TPA: cation diffusion facilitator family transporter [Halococcus sp.]|nr:cation diffusion facilitator family transporter [Halococcus sp.]